jgi:hypothetical protein
MHLSYMDRLGLWGKGTVFPNASRFVKALDSRGIGGAHSCLPAAFLPAFAYAPDRQHFLRVSSHGDARDGPQITRDVPGAEPQL